ncbi:LexA family protein [Leifsonia sp. Leaf264]|uniref:LexA family protein n=1 Tax=Leifsonia sp. Leaf264 TaxID=1736314 RepID=UPI0006F49BB2|nr:translesion error-prone DNA polymerase V autoproteolytic subunit [Leifsonia sp. Leaf264]KQO98629.1 peptidase S24 [Leifsonia sp. Leaf264]
MTLAVLPIDPAKSLRRQLPLYAPVAVPAGFPSPAQDYYNGPVDLNTHLIQDPTSTFIIRVSGESMTGVGIYDGDEVIVDRSLTPTDGSVVIAILDGDLTLKRLRMRGGSVALHAENPDFPDIILRGDANLSIWGVVTICLHHVR